jgi:hypothetical protein
MLENPSVLKLIFLKPRTITPRTSPPGPKNASHFMFRRDKSKYKRFVFRWEFRNPFRFAEKGKGLRFIKSSFAE